MRGLAEAANAALAWPAQRNPIHWRVAAAREGSLRKHAGRLIDSNADQIRLDLPRVESAVRMMVAGDEILEPAFPAGQLKNKIKQTKINRNQTYWRECQTQRPISNNGRPFKNRAAKESQTE